MLLFHYYFYVSVYSSESSVHLPMFYRPLLCKVYALSSFHTWQDVTGCTWGVAPDAENSSLQFFYPLAASADSKGEAKVGLHWSFMAL